MTWEVVYTLTAKAAIRKLDPGTRNRVRAAVEELSRDPLQGRLLSFTLKGLRSWRTGDWRIIYKAEAERVVVVVVTVGHRRDVYERVRRLLS
ncbi:MAG: type II toxin-antitoxin system mRNA interferase toxin, RelE/StbE family [Thermoanaerobaculia bacterium]|nr:type II toxin-antitoxin system mRNA interferase toxin, RelE/StbE family [Thermoanaerobaculia bacterium]